MHMAPVLLYKCRIVLLFSLVLQLRSLSGGCQTAFRGHVKSGDSTHYILFQTVTLTGHRYRLTGLQSHPFFGSEQTNTQSQR